MPIRYTAIALFAGVLAMAPGADRAAEAEPSYLFMQTASDASYSQQDGTLTLGGLHPSTVYFSDRPERKVGSLSNAQFVEAWSGASDSFTSDPPNAGLSFGTGEQRSMAVVELTDPVLIDGGIRYHAKVLKGDLPAALGPAALVIDAALIQLVAQGVQDVYLTHSPQ